MENADKKLSGEKKKQFDDYLEFLNDGAHWVLEKNNGQGMPPGIPEKIIKLYEKSHIKRITCSV